ncbi:MAG TPA: Lrp/AsnC family transcriptional regulator [Stellaceae bacterium]|jgi:Lrp/AsnC family transcriptional regulator|nr:Lrp/AsnC family transcriptional regulator [Stellaceae bacterium]
MLQNLDEFDRSILRIYQQDPGISMDALGAKVGLSHTPCWRRLRKLEDAGIIRGKSLELDREALGLRVVVIVQVRLRQHDEQTLLEFEAGVQRQPEIVDCYSVAGDHDYFMKIVCADAKDYERLLKKTLLHLPGVVSVNSHFCLNEVKHTSRLPL